jgi:histidinol-phosphatase (PHP family)
MVACGRIHGYIGSIMTHHLHTEFSDGRDSPRRMVEAALALGWTVVGISDHAPVEGEDWCMPASRLDEYFSVIGGLKREFAGRIEVLIGLELDWRETGGLAVDPRLEYWIGSFHFFEVDGAKHAIDGSLDMVRTSLALAAGGSGRRFAGRYWRGVTDLVAAHRPPVAGHLDLLKKHNPTLGMFDPAAAWYRDLAEEALEAIRQAGSVVEVNTGGMARGYGTEPYPSWALLERVRELGLPIQLNSDTHQSGTIDFAYAETAERLRGMGFREQRVLSGGSWRDIAL